MTQIKFRKKPVWHETSTTYDHRAVVVAQEPDALLLRLKGTRGVMRLPWSIALIKAAMLEAAAERIRKINEKKAKKKGK